MTLHVLVGFSHIGSVLYSICCICVFNIFTSTMRKYASVISETVPEPISINHDKESCSTVDPAASILPLPLSVRINSNKCYLILLVTVVSSKYYIRGCALKSLPAYSGQLQSWTVVTYYTCPFCPSTRVRTNIGSSVVSVSEPQHCHEHPQRFTFVVAEQC